MKKYISLVDAMKPKAIAIAGVLSDLITNSPDVKDYQTGQMINYKNNPWAGYSKDEGLVGHLISNDCLTYYRKSNHNAKLTMGFLTMVDIKEHTKSDPIVLSENIIERYVDEYNFEEAVEYVENIKHTFSKTMTYEEAAKRAWDVAVKAALSVGYAGVSGSIEAAAKYGEELSQKTTYSTTQTDEISKTITIKGPVHIQWEAKRVSSKIRRTVRAVCDFDFKLYFHVPVPELGGRGTFEWYPFKTHFVPLLKGVAPEDDVTHYIFKGKDIPEDVIEAIDDPSSKAIEFNIDWDNVNSQVINVTKV